jgi:putative ABC transport system substrate-binding protein
MSIRLQRREFIAALGGAVAWPLAARAQQRQQMRRVVADDPEGQARLTAFVQGLQALGWSDGRTVRIDYRWAVGDAERLRISAAEIVALTPDVILAGGNPAVAALQQATRTIPIVFAGIADPVGSGFVGSLAHPGSNATGFMGTEFAFGAKRLELLKQIAPRVTRVAVVLASNLGSGVTEYAAIQAVAPSLGIELTPIRGGRDAGESNQGITEFARGPNDGLIVTTGGVQQAQREIIIAAAARHRLPSVYPFRRFVVEGGLISFGPDLAEPYRQVASYADRILKGEKPSELPVQAPTKFETVLNVKTAKTLGLDIPATVYARADEIIE